MGYVCCLYSRGNRQSIWDSSHTTSKSDRIASLSDRGRHPGTGDRGCRRAWICDFSFLWFIEKKSAKDAKDCFALSFLVNLSIRSDLRGCSGLAASTHHGYSSRLEFLYSYSGTCRGRCRDVGSRHCGVLKCASACPRPMKASMSIVSLFTAAMASLAQGTLNFSTRITGVVDAPVMLDGSKVGSDWWGQLYAGPVGGDLAAVGSPVEFRDDVGIGYISAGGAVAVPGVPGGSPAQVKLVAWLKSSGNNYEAAVASGQGAFGESAAIVVPVTGNPTGVPPTPPANLAGLQGFSILLIPEPSAWVIGSLGAGIFLFGMASRGRQTSDPAKGGPARPALPHACFQARPEREVVSPPF